MDQDKTQRPAEVTLRYVVRYHGDQLARARNGAGLSQTEMGRLMGFTQQYVAQLEELRIQTREFTEIQYAVLRQLGLI